MRDRFIYFTVLNTVMVTVIKRQKAHFRIDIRDLKTGKIRTISLMDHDKSSIEDIKKKIIDCIDNNCNQEK